MVEGHAGAFVALASLSVVPPEMQQACATIQDELGSPRIVVEPAWQPFARACGLRGDGGNESNEGAVASLDGPCLAVGPDVEWALAHRDGARREFGLVVPAAVRGRGTRAVSLDPTLTLWKRACTPVTVHRVPIDTGTGVVEVLVAVLRWTTA